jgi:hypothetical protein
MIRRRASRALVATLSALLVVLLAGQTVLAAVSWSSPVFAGPRYGWNLGQGLARTVTSTSSYLHVQYSNDNVDPLGVYYRQGNAGGTSWGTAKRLNPGGEHAERGAIAATGSKVYVAWTTGAHLDPDYDPSAARRLRVRVNTSHGASTAWLATRSIDNFTRVGRPAIAASAGRLYVVVTDADSGQVHLIRNDGNNTSGGGWLGTHVGTTTRTSGVIGDGYEGSPVVAAAGAVVMVAWVGSDAGTIKAKVSKDYGKTWPATASTLASGQVWDLSASAGGTRIGIAWARETGIRARLYTGGAWRTTRTVASFSPTATYKAGYGTAIALAGTGRVGVAFSACTRLDCSAGATKGVNVRWRESTDNGARWRAAVTIASYAAGSARRINDFPSVVMTTKPKRFITYNTASPTFSTYRLMVEVGRGKP